MNKFKYNFTMYNKEVARGSLYINYLVNFHG